MHAFWKLLRRNGWLAVPLGLLLEYLVVPDHRSIVLRWAKKIGGAYACLGIIAGAIKNEDCLWHCLGNFLAFARSEVGITRTSSPGKPHAAWLIEPRAIQRLAIMTLVVYMVRTRKSRERSSYQSLFWPERSLPMSIPYRTPGSNHGYTAHISSCYDGDTCYLDQLSFEGVLLPPLFQNMKLRLRGIDAPERRQSQCLFEKCLADLSRDVLEEILVTGNKNSDDNGETLLEDCRHDKYGGRLLCDVHTVKGNVAELMIESGLAVPYHGGTKTSPWCHPTYQQDYIASSSNQQRSRLNIELQRCLAAGGKPK